MGCRLCVLCANAAGRWIWIYGPVGARRAVAVCELCHLLIAEVDSALTRSAEV